MTMLDEFKRALPKEMKLVSAKECNDKFNKDACKAHLSLV